VGSETETVTVEGIPFPAEITAGGNPLSLLATGIYIYTHMVISSFRQTCLL
jgi:hypothetical protein